MQVRERVHSNRRGAKCDKFLRGGGGGEGEGGGHETPTPSPPCPEEGQKASVTDVRLGQSTGRKGRKMYRSKSRGIPYLYFLPE